MSDFQKAYLALVIAALLVAFSPLKAVAYLVPFAGFFVLLFFGHRWQILPNLAFTVSIWLLLVLFHAAFGPDFLWQNALLWFITHGAIIFMLTVPCRSLASQAVIRKTAKFCLWLLIFESLWGVAQAYQGYQAFGSFDGAIGDYVSGTISPFGPDQSFSNPIFAVNIAVLMVFVLVAHKNEIKLYLALLLGTVALLFTSVLHLIFFFFFALVVSQTFFGKKSLRKAAIVLGVGVFLLSGLFITQKTNLSLYHAYWTLLTRNELPKVEVTRRVVEDIAPRDWMFATFGYGPGQFVSRAGLIGSGRYLGSPENPRKLPFIPAEISGPVENNVVDLWRQSLSGPGYAGSAMAKPWYSWLVIFTELGAVGFSAAVLFVFWILIFMWRLPQPSIGLQWRAFVCFLVVFYACIGWVENYWETAQAVFPGILLGKMLFSCRDSYLPRQEGTSDPLPAITGVEKRENPART